MAIYHCTCKIVSRGKGRSAVAAAAYRAADKITNEYEGLTYNFSRKGGVVYSEVMLCKNAPAKYSDRAILWNSVEKAEKNTPNRVYKKLNKKTGLIEEKIYGAQLAREFEIALPRELNLNEQIEFCRKLVKNFTNKGMCADWSIHDKGDGNPHVHILLTTRAINKDGSWAEHKQKKEYALDEKGERIPIIDPKTGEQKVDGRNRKQWKRVTVNKSEWDSPKFLKDVRANVAHAINAELERKGLTQRVDHRSYKEQGINKQPTKHEGVAQRNMKKKIAEGKMEPIVWEYDKAALNEEIKKANGQMQTLKILSRQIEKELGRVEDDIEWQKVHEYNAELEERLAGVSTKEELDMLRDELEQRIEFLQNIQPSKASVGRTMDGTEDGELYYDYHLNKALSDADFVRQLVGDRIENLVQAKNEVIRENNSRLEVLANSGMDTAKYSKTLDELVQQGKIPVLYVDGNRLRVTYFTTPAKAVALMEQTRGTIVAAVPKAPEQDIPAPATTPEPSKSLFTVYGFDDISERSMSERGHTILADIRVKDSRVHGLIDTDKIDRIIAEQNYQRKQKRPYLSKTEEQRLVAEIQSSFRCLEYVEQHHIYGYEQIIELYGADKKMLEATKTSIAESEKLLGDARAVLLLPEEMTVVQDRIDSHRNDIKYILEEYSRDKKMVAQYKAMMAQYGIATPEGLRGFEQRVSDFEKRLEAQKLRLIQTEAKMSELENCIRTFDRIDTDRGIRNVNAMREFDVLSGRIRPQPKQKKKDKRKDIGD